MGSEVLLQRAVEEIRKRIGANSLFFVEDTSVKIDALSGDGSVVPGLRVKEWFRDTTFEALDDELKRRGNRREATVRSDIGLYIPGLERTVFVFGETAGRVAESPPQFAMSYRFPWLTPSTFNGWFVPRGSEKTLGEMDFAESFQFDFRVRSLTKLLDRIEEYAAVGNLPAQAYAVRRIKAVGQGSLFPARSLLILVVGRICAGKTTFGRHVADAHGWLHVEASDEMNALATECDEKGVEDLFLRAKELLRHRGPDCVARSIVKRYYGRLDGGVVITGFRAIEEVVYFRNRYPSCVVMYINAGDRVRFSRHLERGRWGGIRTRDEFEAHDREQWSLGLLARARDIVDVPRDIADVEVENEFGLAEYFGQIDGVLERLGASGGSGVVREEISEVRGVVRLGRSSLRGRRALRCLRALRGFREPATCAEVQSRMAEEEEGGAMSARHVNWVLGSLPELAERIVGQGRLRYRIRSAGRAYVEAVKVRRVENVGEGAGGTGAAGWLGGVEERMEVE